MLFLPIFKCPFLQNLLRKIRRIFTSHRPFRLRLPAELVDESLKFLPYQKCAELARTSRRSRSHFLAELAKYRVDKFPKFMAKIRPINSWLLKAIRRMLIYHRVGIPLERYEAVIAVIREINALIKQRQLAKKNAERRRRMKRHRRASTGNPFATDSHSAKTGRQSIYGSASDISFQHRHSPIHIV